MLCFRVVPPGLTSAAIDALQAQVYRAIEAGGERRISLAALDGRPVLRVTAVSPAQTLAALLDTVAAIEAEARRAT